MTGAAGGHEGQKVVVIGITCMTTWPIVQLVMVGGQELMVKIDVVVVVIETAEVGVPGSKKEVVEIEDPFAKDILLNIGVGVVVLEVVVGVVVVNARFRILPFLSEDFSSCKYLAAW